MGITVSIDKYVTAVEINQATFILSINSAHDKIRILLVTTMYFFKWLLKHYESQWLCGAYISNICIYFVRTYKTYTLQLLGYCLGFLM